MSLVEFFRLRLGVNEVFSVVSLTAKVFCNDLPIGEPKCMPEWLVSNPKASGFESNWIVFDAEKNCNGNLCGFSDANFQPSSKLHIIHEFLKERKFLKATIKWKTFKPTPQPCTHKNINHFNFDYFRQKKNFQVFQ